MTTQFMVEREGKSHTIITHTFSEEVNFLAKTIIGSQK